MIMMMDMDMTMVVTAKDGLVILYVRPCVRVCLCVDSLVENVVLVLFSFLSTTMYRFVNRCPLVALVVVVPSFLFHSFILSFIHWSLSVMTCPQLPSDRIPRISTLPLGSD